VNYRIAEAKIRERNCLQSRDIGLEVNRAGDETVLGYEELKYLAYS
jgi:hypothetical protein